MWTGRIVSVATGKMHETRAVLKMVR